MDTVRHDLKYAFRQLGRNPGFAAVAILTLGLGIGANTAIFSVVNGVVLQPLEYEEPDRLYTIWEDWTLRADRPREWTGRSVFSEWRERNRTFEGMAAVQGALFTLRSADGAVPLQGARVSPGYFRVLGVGAALGRTFLGEEEGPGRGDVLVLSHGLWQSRFGGDPDVLGRAITLDGEPYTVVGVAPPGFRGPILGPVDVWAPLVIDPAQPDWGNVYLRVIGRLRPGTSEEEAARDMERVAGVIAEMQPEANGDVGASVQPLHDFVVGPVRAPLLVLLGAVALVLLIACVNVANLMLSRASRRRRELAVRSAIGAGRGRLVRQLLTESLALSALGGALGVALGVWGMGALRAAAPPGTPRIEEVALSTEVLLFALAATVLTGLAFGILPALRAGRSDAVEALGEGGRGPLEGGRSRLRSALVVAEVALGLTLLVGAGLLVRSLASLQGVDPGYRTEGVLTGRLILTDDAYPEGDQLRAFWRELERRLSARPEVVSTGATMVLPLGDADIDLSFVLEGTSPEPGREPGVEFTRVTPGYFETLGVPLVRGRRIADGDAEGAPLVAMVNEAFVRRHVRGEDPIGRRLHFGSVRDTAPTWRTIVGVVGDVRQEGLAQEAEAEVYLPYAQSSGRAMYLVARAARGRPAESLAPVVRDVLASLDRDIPLRAAATMGELIRRDLAAPRFVTLLLGAFAAVALLLAAVGLYGVLAYSVARRTRELGVRIALGAEAGDVLTGIMGRGLALVGIGLGIGLAAALGLTRFLASLLYGVGPTDPLTLAAVSLLLLGVGAAACWIPARRATRVDPAVALRAD